MKLNHDCVRYLLLHLEEHPVYNKTFISTNANTDKYDIQTTTYSLDKLIDAGYLRGKKSHYDCDTLPIINITAITWDGHAFLDTIRDNRVWKDTQNILSKFSSVSLNLVSDIAKQVISAIIKMEMNL